MTPVWFRQNGVLLSRPSSGIPQRTCRTYTSRWDEGADKFNQTYKVVYSKTLVVSEWENTILAKGNLVDEIEKLKTQDGGDLIAYGGATLVSALIKHQLIDEFHLLINPVSISQGLTIFAKLDQP